MEASQALLIEIGTEELPPLGLYTLEENFKNLFFAELTEHKIAFNPNTLQAFSTPRRLALLCEELASQQSPQDTEKKGPAVEHAYDDQGTPTAALVGFAKSCNTTIERLTEKDTPKGRFVFFQQTQPGLPTKEILPKILEKVLSKLPLPKKMRWADKDIAFIRPIHWITVLFGKILLSEKIFGLKTQTTAVSYGHRFLAPEKIHFSDPTAYENTLLKAKVMPDFRKRKAFIESESQKIGHQLDATPLMRDTLLNEVTALVEWPIVLLGKFNPDFLSVPKEALISAIEYHQKCFPLLNEKDELLPCFILVANIEMKDYGPIIQGFEKVMHARLSDAAFLYEQDLKTPLSTRQSALRTIIFEQSLGSVSEKVQRMGLLAEYLHEKINPQEIHLAKQAALLSKADLTTQMVLEFPELQGIMGYYYALAEKKSPKVAKAIQEQYLPQTATDVLPKTPLGITLALADRIDTLTGIFGIGKSPTGQKDPFALRRQAIAILRILVENKIDLDLKACFETSFSLYPNLENHALNTLLTFCFERFRAWYTMQHMPAQLFDAVMATHPTSPFDFHARVLATHAFLALPQAKNLIAAHKRVSNLLSKTQETLKIQKKRLTSERLFEPHGGEFSERRQRLFLDFQGVLNFDVLEEPAEKNLAEAMQNKHTEIIPFLKEKQYEKVLVALASLQPMVDAFFDQVLVLCENQSVQKNRLTLLSALQALFLNVADIAYLEGIHD